MTRSATFMSVNVSTMRLLLHKLALALLQIDTGSQARFYPEASDYPVLDGAVVHVQSVPTDFLNKPLLASLNGGEIPARKDVTGS